MTKKQKHVVWLNHENICSLVLLHFIKIMTNIITWELTDYYKLLETKSTNHQLHTLLVTFYSSPFCFQIQFAIFDISSSLVIVEHLTVQTYYKW